MKTERYYFIEDCLFEVNFQLINSIDNELKKLGLVKVNQINLSDYVFFFNSRMTNELSVHQKTVRCFCPNETIDLNCFILDDQNDWELFRSFICEDTVVFEDNLKKQILLTNEKKIKKLSHNIQLSPQDLKVLTTFESNFYQLNSSSEIQDLISNEDFFENRGIKLLSFKDMQQNKLDNFLVVSANINNLWVMTYDDNYLNVATFLFAILCENFKRFRMLEKSQEEIRFWDKIFSLIDEPIVMIDASEQITFYNSYFISLNVSASDCLSFVNNQQVKINQNFYRIFIKDICEENKKIIYFIPIDEEFVFATNSSEEVGIISSSLAHELNNPLAGILAAISLLELDDNDTCFMQNLSDMKSGALRCKKLVETFLGFSRPSESSYYMSYDLKETFEQALDLMRFRIVENNIKFDISYQNLKCEKIHFNSSVMTMLFYLLLGEILTSYSHFILVSKQVGTLISLNIVHFGHKIKIHWNENYHIDDSFKKSKLIQHLLETQNAKISFENSVEITFTKSASLEMDKNLFSY